MANDQPSYSERDQEVRFGCIGAADMDATSKEGGRVAESRRLSRIEGVSPQLVSFGGWECEAEKAILVVSCGSGEHYCMIIALLYLLAGD